MNTFNSFMTFIFRLLLAPFQSMDPLWGLLIISILTGIFMLWIFKMASNQQAIGVTKNRIKAHLLAIRLYRHDVKLSLIAMGQIFAENGRYFLLALRPMLVMIVPMLLLLFQLSVRYGNSAAPPEKPLLISVRVSETADPKQIILHPTMGITIETPALFVSQTNQLYWRIRPQQNGIATLTFQYIDRTESKKLAVGTRRQPLATKRVPTSFAAFLYPVEHTLKSDSFLREIKVDYPAPHIRVAGIQLSWLVFFFIVSVATGFLAKGVFKVQL